MTSILVDQRTYIDIIVPMDISHSTGSQDRCLERQEYSDYRGILGTLLWALTATRPDHAYRIRKLSQQTGAPTERHAIQANKLLHIMKRHALVLWYPQLTGELRLIGYHDRSRGNAEMVVRWEAGFGYCQQKMRLVKETFSPLQWRSKT